MGIQVCSKEQPCSFPRGNITNKLKYIDNILKNILQNHWANFNQTGLKAFFGFLVKEIQVCSDEGPHPFQKGDNIKIVRKINSTNLSTKQSCVKKNQFCSNEGPRMCLFSREDNNEIAKKIINEKFKIFFSKTTWRISIYLN